MKLRLKNSRPQGGGPAAGGFTLTEIMVATAILVIVVGGIMSAHVFGLRKQINQEIHAPILAGSLQERIRFVALPLPDV